jgi:Spy/CpxP family protein refolding chaperone
MTRLAILLSLAALLALAAPSIAQTTSPYAGQEQRSIKALSESEIRDLMEARGMGLAKAAELNSYPGPLHVMELARQLDLSEAQRTATQSLYASMRDEAPSLGGRIVEAEWNLDQAFATGRIDPTDLRTRVNAIAALQGELRVVHLNAHLVQLSLLTPEQVARYNALRGYDASVVSHGAHRHGGD